MRTKIDKIKKKLFSLSYDTMAPTAKPKTFVSTKKVRKGIIWINNGGVMEETFKDWKALIALTLQVPSQSIE